MELESSARAICHFHHNVIPGSLLRFLFHLVPSVSAANRTCDGGQILDGSLSYLVAQHAGNCWACVSSIASAHCCRMSIVLVATAAEHRGNAFASCEFIIDYLKTAVPFWKKEVSAQDEEWLGTRESDVRRMEKWRV